MQNQNKDKENRYPEYEAPENGMQPRQHTGRPPEERDPHRRQHLPAVRIAAQRKRAPVFDTHYFLTAMTHIFVALASLGFAAYMVVQLAGNLTTPVTTSAAIKISEPEYVRSGDCQNVKDKIYCRHGQIFGALMLPAMLRIMSAWARGSEASLHSSRCSMQSRKIKRTSRGST